MELWKENPHQLLQIDISWNTGGESGSQFLLERWRVHYEYNNSTVLGEVTPQLKQVYKRVGVLLRVLYSYVRMLPAHRVSQLFTSFNRHCVILTSFVPT
jgi:hypothetical protein